MEQQSARLNKLDALIPQFAESKELSDKWTKVCESYKQDIKDIMADLVIQHRTVGDYTVKRVVQEKQSFNEPLLIEIIKRIAPDLGLIKTKEYVDMDALEAAIYNDELSKEDLLEIQKAKDTKLITQLRISKARKRKNEEE